VFLKIPVNLQGNFMKKALPAPVFEELVYHKSVFCARRRVGAFPALANAPRVCYNKEEENNRHKSGCLKGF